MTTLFGEHRFNGACDLSVNFAFRLNGFCPCLGTEFSPAGENSGGFCPRMKRGCLHHLESSAKYTKVLPQAKCRETSLYCHSLSANSLKGSGNFLLRKFPVSPVSLVSLHKGIISGRIISSPTNHLFKFFGSISSPAVRIDFLERKSPRILRVPRRVSHRFPSDLVRGSHPPDC